MKQGLLRICLVFFVVLGCVSGVEAQSLSALAYDIGSPVLQELWVSPASGNDSASGASRAEALRTVNEAWNRIPSGAPLSGTGYRINLVAGEYPVDSLPNYWENRIGTFRFPIILRAVDGPRTAVFRGGPNVFNAQYLYFIDISFAPIPAGDAFHCELCEHVLLRGVVANGGARAAQETVKVNQSRYFYIEDSDIAGAHDNAIDFVAVQYGHIVRNRIHNAEDWCAYVKGGSAYITVEANRFYDCGTGGFTTGQGSGFEYTVSPWLHYEAYDIKVMNNVVHDTEGAGLGVNGGYNILLAHNTLYRVGTRSHVIEVVFGYRSCDGDPAACAARLALGGWGTSQTGVEGEPIGNRNIFIYNNLVFNPAGVQSGSQHFAIYGPRTPTPGSNLPAPVRTDVNLRIRGNVVWNGSALMPLGIEEDDQGCRPSNPACNGTQLRSENVINALEPVLGNPGLGDFRPIPGSALLAAPTFEIPAFPGGDRPVSPPSEQGTLENAVLRDRSGALRGGQRTVGAYSSSESAGGDPLPPETTTPPSPPPSPSPGPDEPTPGYDAPPEIISADCSIGKVKRQRYLVCVVRPSDDRGVVGVSANVLGRYEPAFTAYPGGVFSLRWPIPKLSVRRFAPLIHVFDSAGQVTSVQTAPLRYR